MTRSHTDLAWPTDGLSYGGDYNPEQWDRSVWREDVELMRRAGVNMVSLGIFSWGLLETAEGVYDWEWFDEIVDLLGENGISIDLATPTAAPPSWLLAAHPEFPPIDEDMTRHWPGARLGWCPSNPDFRVHALRIVRAVAERYGSREHVVMWHVSNELGGGNGHCYCDASAVSFRRWAQRKYGTIDAVNAAWGTAFWGHRFTSFEEIFPPRGNDAKNPSLMLDYDRFSSDELLDHYLAERALLQEITPELPITTNFMVGAESDAVDYPRWAPHMDVLANDHYTRSSDPLPEQDVALSGDRMRAMTTDRRPWLLMEHSTSAVSWQPRNRAKNPGELIRNALSHVAHGADGVMFFQWRASRAGAEQFHSAMVPHAGADTKVFREVTTLGSYLQKLAPVQGSRVRPSTVGILFDDEAGWAMRRGVKPNNFLPYGQAVRAWHKAFWQRGDGIDVLSPWQDFSGYDTLVVPQLFLVSDDTARRAAEFVEAGGTLIVTAFSGIVDENDQVRLGGYPGAFREVLGAWSEEFYPLQDGETFELDNGWGGTEWTEHVHTESAETIARYRGGHLDGSPAVTLRTFPSGGRAVYVSAGLEGDAIAALVDQLIAQPTAVPGLGTPGLEVGVRESEDERFVFLLNHGAEAASVEIDGHELLTDAPVSGTVTVPAGETRVIRSPR
ncbi:beta-galactosidase [Labedella gwakjiensis]|uniref:Beta-galactosidase n=1 Tax=Labedella gwakjiensis TaxID=390269 RepID=A0A2P8GTY7_9MICO|nr:beta-galactosidase [Labedella gwakjiensis]PSL37432.1 beta-galactosidase [Labedella gwakjiensis]RUQ84746.1 beta-galactosidase [Labedella gwakjiensis]